MMKRTILALTIILTFGAITRANAPTPNENANVYFVTICNWNTDPVCLVYKVVNGISKLWK